MPTKQSPCVCQPPAGVVADSAVVVFQRLAQETWERLRLGQDLRVSQSEETITDLNLLEIARAQLPRLHVFKADKHQEAAGGFDWEWWIGSDSSKWLRYCVQAKKLDVKSGLYKSLRHLVGDHMQIKVLEDFAKQQRAIPLYCFYNYVKHLDGSSCWHCSQPPEPPQLGCTLVPLQEVKQCHQPQMRRGFEQLHAYPRALPWRCLIRWSYTPAGLRASGIHPLASRGIPVGRHDALPAVLRQALSERQDIVLEGDLYANEHGVYPERIMILNTGG